MLKMSILCFIKSFRPSEPRLVFELERAGESPHHDGPDLPCRIDDVQVSYAEESV